MKIGSCCQGWQVRISLDEVRALKLSKYMMAKFSKPYECITRPRGLFEHYISLSLHFFCWLFLSREKMYICFQIHVKHIELWSTFKLCFNKSAHHHSQIQQSLLNQGKLHHSNQNIPKHIYICHQHHQVISKTWKLYDDNCLTSPTKWMMSWSLKMMTYNPKQNSIAWHQIYPH